MTTLSRPTLESTSTAEHFDLTGFRGLSARLTRSLLAPWDLYKKSPKDAQAQGIKSRIKADRADPMPMVLRLAFAAVDVGIPVEAVVAWAREYIVVVQEYAQRRQRRLGIGTVLPFPVRFARLNAKDAVEQGESSSACWQVGDGSSREALERCRKELTDEKAVVDAQIALLDERIASLPVKA